MSAGPVSLFLRQAALHFTLISKGLKTIWLIFRHFLATVDAKLNLKLCPVLPRPGRYALNLATWLFVYCSAQQIVRY